MEQVGRRRVRARGPRRRGWVWWRRRSKAFAFAVSAGLPVVAFGLAVAVGWVSAYGDEGSPVLPVLVVGLVASLLAGLWLSPLTLTDLLAIGVLCVACAAAVASLHLSVLARRGETVRCTVEVVDEHVQRGHEGEGGEGTRTRYSYLHHLRCPGGYPDRVRTRDEPAAEAGDRRLVTFDPQRRVSARFGDATGGPPRWRTVAGPVLLVGCLVLRVRPWLVDPDGAVGRWRDRWTPPRPTRPPP